MIEVALKLSTTVGVVEACRSLRVSRASYYRNSKAVEEALDTQKTALGQAGQRRALKPEEQSEVVELLNSSRFVDQAPREVFAALLDEGKYLCSVSTMYRMLRAAGEIKERRDQLKHPAYSKPQLVARGPNQVWSWNITKLLGPVKWVYFYLYVILDIYSRYVVGWMVANKESGVLAERLIEESYCKQKIEEGQLVIHSDRGGPMKSKPVAMLLADLGVTKSHSRPKVSNDNPYSESQFKTLKYSREFPERFGSLEDARGYCCRFFGWYNQQHHHSGIGLLTPEEVHYGKASEVIAIRQRVLEEAYHRHPERFPRGMPRAPELPKEVWISRPGSDGSSAELHTKFDEQVSHFY